MESKYTRDYINHIQLNQSTRENVMILHTRKEGETGEVNSPEHRHVNCYKPWKSHIQPYFKTICFLFWGSLQICLWSELVLQHH